MVQGISAAGCAAAQIGGASAYKASGTSFNDALKSASASTGSIDETSSTQDSSKTSDSKSTEKSEKTSSAQTTTCSKCGAIYQGDSPPAICTKCGNDMSAKSSGNDKDPNSLLDTSAASKTTGATDAASAVSGANETSQVGNNMAQFDFSTQIPATISLQ